MPDKNTSITQNMEVLIDVHNDITDGKIHSGQDLNHLKRIAKKLSDMQRDIKTVLNRAEPQIDAHYQQLLLAERFWLERMEFAILGRYSTGFSKDAFNDIRDWCGLKKLFFTDLLTHEDSPVKKALGQDDRIDQVIEQARAALKSGDDDDLQQAFIAADVVADSPSGWIKNGVPVNKNPLHFVHMAMRSFTKSQSPDDFYKALDFAYKSAGENRAAAEWMGERLINSLDVIAYPA